jgi:hypothetical protein
MTNDTVNFLATLSGAAIALVGGAKRGGAGQGRETNVRRRAGWGRVCL